MIFYYVILLIDGIILQVLTFINPQYGMNSSDDVMQVMGVMNELSELTKEMKETAERYKECGFRGPEFIEIQSNISRLNKRYYELLIQLHTNLFDIILNG
jgi:hypothetical protein